MAFSSGTFTNLYDWTVDKTNSIKITASRMQAEFADIATALSTCVLKDGTQTLSGDLPMNSHKLTGLSAGSAAGHSMRYEQIPGEVVSTGAMASAAILALPLTGSWDVYEIFISKVEVAAAGNYPLLRISTDSGVSYKSGATNYHWGFSTANDSAASGNEGSTGSSSIQLASSTGLSNSGANGFFHIRICNPSVGSWTKRIMYDFAHTLNGSGAQIRGYGAGSYTADSNAITHVEILLNSGGNFTCNYTVTGRHN